MTGAMKYRDIKTMDQLEDSLARIIKRLLYNEVFFGMFTMQLKHKWMSDAEMKGT